MSTDGKSTRELLDELRRVTEQMRRDDATRMTRLRVNKRTHRLRFEAETEDSVEVIIEPRGQEGAAPADRGN